MVQTISVVGLSVLGGPAGVSSVDLHLGVATIVGSSF